MRSIMAWRCDVEMLATRVLALGISTALVMLIAAQAAQAQEYLAREAASSRKHHAAPEAYDAQANPNYGFGPRVTVHPNDVLSGNRVSAAIRIPLSGARYCATITPAGLIPDRPRMSPIMEQSACVRPLQRTRPPPKPCYSRHLPDERCRPALTVRASSSNE